MGVTAPPEQEQLSGLESGTAALDEARQYAIAAIKRKRKFAQDAVAYVTVNGLLWLIWLIADRSTDGTIPWPAWVSLVWGFFLALDGWRAYSRWPTSLNRPITQAEVEHELERTTGR